MCTLVVKWYVLPALALKASEVQLFRKASTLQGDAAKGTDGTL